MKRRGHRWDILTTPRSLNNDKEDSEKIKLLAQWRSSHQPHKLPQDRQQNLVNLFRSHLLHLHLPLLPKPCSAECSRLIQPLTVLNHFPKCSRGKRTLKADKKAQLFIVELAWLFLRGGKEEKLSLSVWVILEKSKTSHLENDPLSLNLQYAIRY